MPLNTTPTGPIRVDKNALKLLHDSKSITDVARAYVEADVFVKPGVFTYSLVAEKDVFARVGVGVPEGGGYYVLLKRVNDIWVVIATAQDLPGKDVGQKYGLPTGWFSTEY